MQAYLSVPLCCDAKITAAQRARRENGLFVFTSPFMPCMSLHGLWIQTNILFGGKCVTCVLDIQIQVPTKRFAVLNSIGSCVTEMAS